MADGFDREMRDVDWAEVYERQAARGDLVPRLADRLGLSPGDSVLEIGSGPGYSSFRLAERVSPGVVYAVDRRLAALRYLERRAAAEGVSGVRTVAGDAEALPVRLDEPTPAIAAFVLHHVDAPATAISEVYRALPDGSPFLVVEYDPDAQGEVGPPTDHRIAPGSIRAWLEDAGFDADEAETLPEETYAVPARR